MYTCVDEFIQVLQKAAEDSHVKLCLKTLTEIAIKVLAFSVKDFWVNYKVYMMGAYGHSPRHLEESSKSKMGWIVEAYGKVYGEEVNYEAVVRDVVMYMEGFFISEYNVDISKLNKFVQLYENLDQFSADPLGQRILKIIQDEEYSCNEEDSEELKVTTYLVNEDVVMIESLSTLQEDKAYSPPFDKGSSSQFPPLSAMERNQRLKDRAKQLRRLKKDAKPVKNEDKKIVVETDVFGIPNGKGYTELLHFLSSKRIKHTMEPVDDKVKEIANTVAKWKSEVE